MSLFKRKKKEVKTGGISDTSFPWPLFFNKDELNNLLRLGVITPVTFSNAWLLRRAVLKICEPLSGLPVGLYRVGQDDELVQSDPMLSRIKAPNPLMGQADLFKHISAGYLLTGNGFVMLRDSALSGLSGDTSKRGRIKAMIPVSKHNVTIKVGQDYDISYSVRLPGGAEEILDSDHMINVVSFNPDSLVDGVSAIEGVRDVLNTYQLSGKWNKNLLRNSAKPGGVFTAPGILNDDQYKRLKGQLIDDRSGSENAGEDILLEGGVTYQRMSYSPSDMDWLNARKLSIKEVALAFGIPPELMGDGENKTYNNQIEAKRDFYASNILPFMNSILSAFNRMFWPDGALEFRVIESKVAALQENTTEKVAALKDAWWLTPNQRLAEMNMEQSEDPAMDQVLVPAGLTPISDLGYNALEAMPPRTVPEDEE